MYENIIHGLAAVSNNAISGAEKALSEMPEFCAAAKSLGISRIVRTVATDKSEKTADIYNDSTIPGVFEKAFARIGGETSIVYTFFGVCDFDLLSEDEENAFELITNMFSLSYGCAYMFKEENNRRFIDQQSGIPNKKGFVHFCEEIIAEGRISDYAAICANIKGCNLLNNIFGYQSASSLIVKYAGMLNSRMAEDEICSRFGGDNFFLLVKNNTLDRHLKFFTDTPVEFDMGEEKTVSRVSLRAGIVELDDDIDDVSDIIARAEGCLDVARRKSDGDFVFYDKDAVRRELELTLLESEMPSALQNDEFVVYYQPKVQIDSRMLVGAEALIRWKKNGKLIPPMDFIPIAEHTGFIRKLDMFVLEHTCRLIKRWQDEGKRVVPVSVNFSKAHLRFPGLAEKIMQVIEQYDISPSYIEVEFTETAYTDDFNAIKQAISDLKRCGVMVSMDDFGTGYSSLSLLEDLDFDVLKLDKSLTRMDRGERGVVILENVLNMAKELRMIPICEGVEDEENVENLRNMGCNIIQGYYFDRPLPEEKFEERMISPIYVK